MTDLAVSKKPTALTQQKMSQEQVELLKRTICKGATDDELALFVMQCERTGLDPLSRQVFAVKRWDSQARREVMSIQVSIDGFRLIAQRSKQYKGQLGPWWCGADSIWKDSWIDPLPPMAAKVGVMRKGFDEPLYAVARYGSYVQKTKEGHANTFWARMPEVMIAKVAEALALRKAFPQELSGIYTDDEPVETEPKELEDKKKSKKKEEAPSATATEPKVLDAEIVVDVPPVAENKTPVDVQPPAPVIEKFAATNLVHRGYIEKFLIKHDSIRFYDKLMVAMSGKDFRASVINEEWEKINPEAPDKDPT